MIRLATLALCLAAALEAGELVGPVPRQQLIPQSELMAANAARKDLIWIAGAAAWDLGTTEMALRGCTGCQESNPLLRGSSTRLILKASATAGAGYLCYRLRRAGRHREAKATRWITVGLWVAAGVVNLTHLR